MNDRPERVSDIPMTTTPLDHDKFATRTQDVNCPLTTAPSDHDEFATRTQDVICPPSLARASPFLNLPGYQILGELGRGGMGVVYRARQVCANREVALKMILSGEFAGSAEVARFRTEAEALARLQHPNLVGVFEIGEHAGLPFFSMEYCPGGSLASFARGRSFSAEEASAIVHQLARGMAVAHAAGIVHRDLKPQNVLLAADGTPKVSDFGLVKLLSQGGHEDSAGLTQTGAVLGTPSYMAPEQAFGESKHVGPEADVYALGAILYTLLVDRAPFVGTTPMDTILQVVSEEPERPRNLRREVPQDLEAVCLKCLEKDRRKRYPTAAELAEDLARFLEREPVSALRSGMLGRMAGALDRVQLQDRFAAYGSLLLVLAPIMLLPELWVTVVTWNEWPAYYLPIGQFGRIAAFLVAIGYYRDWRWLPQGPAERHLWLVWGGYLLCCLGSGLSYRLANGLWSTEIELRLYQPLAALTALAFFALTASFWGYCMVIGLGFLALAFVMAIDLRFAPLEFGLTWGLVLILLGSRLRSLSSAREWHGKTPRAGRCT